MRGGAAWAGAPERHIWVSRPPPPPPPPPHRSRRYAVRARATVKVEMVAAAAARQRRATGTRKSAAARRARGGFGSRLLCLGSGGDGNGNGGAEAVVMRRRRRRWFGDSCLCAVAMYDVQLHTYIRPPVCGLDRPVRYRSHERSVAPVTAAVAPPPAVTELAGFGRRRPGRAAASLRRSSAPGGDSARPQPWRAEWRL